MGNEFQPQEVGQMFSDVKRDETINLASLIQNTAKAQNAVEVQKPAQYEKEVVNPTIQSTHQLSPLEQMKAKNATAEKGISITKEEFEKGKEKAPQKNMMLNDERIEAIKETANEMDETLKRRKAIVVVKRPQTDQETTELMMEIDSVVFDADGKASIKYEDDNGNPAEPKYIRLRTPEDPEFDEEVIKKDITPPTNEELIAEAHKKEAEEDPDSVVSEETKKIVQVIIDKTGMGSNIEFTKEEKEKLIEAHEIQLKEVEVQNIESFRGAHTNRSFQEVVNAYTISNSSTKVCFPGSGYKADMKGLTYGELADIALALESVTFDQHYKRLSVIYNKMKNISGGQFESFEAFLRGTAYIDIQMALYGLYVATQPEEQTIELKCQNDGCNKNFDWTYNTRSVLNLEKCSEKFLEKMHQIATAPADQYDTLRKEAPVNNSKFYKLPHSGFVVEIGIVSCYEYLYNIIPVLDEKTFTETFGENASATYAENIFLLTTVRSIRVPDGNGGWLIFDHYKDILDALYEVKPEELVLIRSISDRFITEFSASFEIKDIVCPHCKTVTTSLKVDIGDLVFRAYQRLVSTPINVESLQIF